MLFLRIIFKFLVTLFAIIMILVGLVMTPTPVPFGIVFVLLGFMLLAAVAPDFLRWLRRRWRWLDRQLKRLEKRMPKWLGRHLRKSDVDEDDSERAAA